MTGNRAYVYTVHPDATTGSFVGCGSLVGPNIVAAHDRRGVSPGDNARRDLRDGLEHGTAGEGDHRRGDVDDGGGIGTFDVAVGPQGADGEPPTLRVLLVHDMGVEVVDGFGLFGVDDQADAVTAVFLHVVSGIPPLPFDAPQGTEAATARRMLAELLATVPCDHPRVPPLPAPRPPRAPAPPDQGVPPTGSRPWWCLCWPGGPGCRR